MVSAFSELDLSGISMDAPESVTPARDIATDDDVVLEYQTSLVADGGVVLAQPAITPPAPVSKTLVLTVDADSAQSQKGGGTPTDVLNV